MFKFKPESSKAPQSLLKDKVKMWDVRVSSFNDYYKIHVADPYITQGSGDSRLDETADSYVRFQLECFEFSTEIIHTLKDSPDLMWEGYSTGESSRYTLNIGKIDIYIYKNKIVENDTTKYEYRVDINPLQNFEFYVMEDGRLELTAEYKMIFSDKESDVLETLMKDTYALVKNIKLPKS